MLKEVHPAPCPCGCVDFSYWGEHWFCFECNEPARSFVSPGVSLAEVRPVDALSLLPDGGLDVINAYLDSANLLEAPENWYGLEDGIRAVLALGVAELRKIQAVKR